MFSYREVDRMEIKSVVCCCNLSQNSHGKIE